MQTDKTMYQTSNKTTFRKYMAHQPTEGVLQHFEGDPVENLTKNIFVS